MHPLYSSLKYEVDEENENEQGKHSQTLLPSRGALDRTSQHSS